MALCPLPKRLKEARTAANLSQKELGIAAGIDQFSASPRINQYETGKHTPDFLTLKKIAKVLSVPTAYFYAEKDDLAEAIKSFKSSK
jgi:transcriptional regulator with XRE-family HTH domain